MLEDLLETAKNHWIRAKNDKKHPFHYFTLATTSKAGTPHLRTVVLRDFDPDLFIFKLYTDARTAKVEELNINPRGQLLFYHPKSKLQISVDFTLVDSKTSKNDFNSLPPISKRDYTIEPAPGTPIKNPENIYFETTQNHFRALYLEAFSVEYLQLHTLQHIRARFDKHKQWIGEFLVP